MFLSYLLNIFYSIIRSGNCLWFQKLETRLLSLFEIFSSSIYGIIVWLEESSSWFIALLTNDVLHICLLSMKFLIDYKKEKKTLNSWKEHSQLMS
jgi:uncharacterized membrane protein